MATFMATSRSTGRIPMRNTGHNVLTKLYQSGFLSTSQAIASPQKEAGNADFLFSAHRSHLQLMATFVATLGGAQ